MTSAELIMTIVVFILAGVWLLVGILSFFEKGFLLNNAYIYASKAERKAMDKKPYYKQTAIVFCIMSLMFIIIGLSVVLKSSTIALLDIPVAAAAIIYAIVSAVLINKKTKKGSKHDDPILHCAAGPDKGR